MYGVSDESLIAQAYRLGRADAADDYYRELKAAIEQARDQVKRDGPGSGSYLLRSIDALELSERTHSILIARSIFLVGQLTRMTRQVLLDSGNLSQEGLEEINTALGKWNLRLAG